VDGEWRVVSYDVERRVPEPGQFPRLSAVPHPGEPDRARGRAIPEVPSKGLLFFLVIGSDARPGERVGRLRADSIHIVGVNPKRRGGAILGIPRDSFVHIPGAGTRKINDALSIGGPRLMVRTVRRLTGIPIDGYLLTGFKGFASFVGRIGGLRVKVPYRMNDAASGARFRRGVRRLSGNGALAFARNRHDAPGGDFGRSHNQGRLILAALRTFRKAVRREPAALFTWVVAGMATVRTNLSLGEALGMMLAAPRIEPSRVKNRVVSGSGGMAGGASVVHLGAPAQRMFRDLRRDGMLRG
jgi:LCP family protein required for cell wall assembly